MSEQIDTSTGWVSPDVLNDIRDRVPLVYVDAVPVRVDEEGRVTHVGMLLRQAADGTISRMVVSGRVLLNERIREALLRHLEKDLGHWLFHAFHLNLRHSPWWNIFKIQTSAGSTTHATMQ